VTSLPLRQKVIRDQQPFGRRHANSTADVRLECRDVREKDN
jgi:hypothetical protein